MPQRVRVEVPYRESFRTATVAGMFDVPVEEKLAKEWVVDLPAAGDPADWQIGLLVGPSGAGKTRIATAVYGEEALHQGFQWPRDAAVIDGFPQKLSVKAITTALSHVGFSSPPAWLLPYHCLSNGQQFRAELARLLVDPAPLVVVDEFTSVVDRTVAKAASAAVAKAVRRQEGKQLVACSCHEDIIDWCEPDWVFEVAHHRLHRRRLRRPSLELTVHEVHRDAWALFRPHHYLSAQCHRAARCFGAFLGDRMVGFCAVLHFPNKHYRRAKRIHRTVVLPDFQGLGIGTRMVEAVAGLFRARGYRTFATTSHPASIHARARSPRWRMTRPPSHASLKGNIKNSCRRLTASFEYVGPPWPPKEAGGEGEQS